MTDDKKRSSKKIRTLELDFDVPSTLTNDAPISDMTIRDLAAILLKKPVSKKEWLNELIK
jgi:hypothetical protein